MLEKAPPIPLREGFLETSLPSFVMSIINCTPDSFYEKSRFLPKYNNLQKTVEFILQEFENGADIVDIGGESTRPGSEYIGANEELDRVIPLIQEVRKHTRKALSIDTRKAIVLEEAIKAGADILNDISALEDDVNIVAVAAEAKIPIILMHKRDTPLTMQENTVYNNIVVEIADYLSSRVTFATTHGIEASKIILDSGIGFGKKANDNCSLITSSTYIKEHVANVSGVETYGVLVGLSRKSFIGDITSKPVEHRLAGTLAANIVAVQHGARIVRVHDVVQTVDALKILQHC